MRQTIGRALANLIQLPEPYLSLHCGRISPLPQQQKKKDILSSIVNKLAHMCVFAVNESTATRKIPSPSVCKGVSAWRTDRLHKEVGEEV